MLRNRWITVFIIFPYLNIFLFDLSYIQPLVYLWQYLAVIIALIILPTQIKKYTMLVMLFFGAIITSSLINGGTLSPGLLFNLGSIFSLIIYVSYCLEKPKEITYGLFYLLSTLIILNLIISIFMIISGNLDNQVFFLGRRNHIAFTIILYFLVSNQFNLLSQGKHKILVTVLNICAIFSLIIAGSSTGLVISALLIIFYLVPFKKPKLGLYFFVFLVSFYSIVIIRIQESKLAFFVQEYLNRGVTFTGRTYVWDFVIEELKDSLIFGVGRGSNVIGEYFHTINEAHNGLLAIALDSGIIGLSIFFILILYLSYKLSKCKHDFSSVTSFAVFLFLICSLTENTFLLEEFWIVITFAFNIHNIIKENSSFSHEEVIK